MIANVFYKAGFIENWGRGFDKVIKGFKVAGIELPVVENEFGGTSVLVQRKVEAKTDVVKDVNITDRQKQIISYITANPKISLVELSEKISISRRTIAAEVTILKEKEIIRRLGSDKNGCWEILGK